jgi:uncharacterized protein
VSARDELEAWLAAGAGGRERALQVHQTPIATVFVYAERVLKLKKPVDFGFLDFTTCEKRAWATRRELEFNRRTAPDVYRAVHTVVRTAEGLALVDPGQGGDEPIDHVLEMRPFETDHILANHPEQVDGAIGERLGREIARAQAGARLTPEGRGAAALDYVLRSNADQLRRLAPGLDGDAVEELVAETGDAFEEHRPLLDRRRDTGYVRRCHGDLHLGNIVMEAGRPILFDCIEFNDVLSEIDVGYDIAFLLMDLRFRGRPEAANRVLSAWLDGSGHHFGAGRMSGLAALPLFQSVRAAVRAHVSGNAGQLETAQGYFDAARGHLRAVQPRLFAVGGLSGSGKSTFARRLAPEVGAAPGAVVLRTDEIRKRVFGVQPADRLPKAAYAPEISPRVYALMLDEARAALRAGWSVILDAAFLRTEERDGAEVLAREAAVPFTGCWMQADEAVLRNRLRSRTGDASDADEAVLEAQLRRGVGDVGWRRVDAAVEGARQLQAALA